MLATFAILIAGIAFTANYTSAQELQSGDSCLDYAARQMDRYIDEHPNAPQSVLTEVMNYFYAICALETRDITIVIE